MTHADIVKLIEQSLTNKAREFGSAGNLEFNAGYLVSYLASRALDLPELLADINNTFKG